MASAVKIVGGPSKWDLSLALFERRVVTFKLEGGSKVDVEVRSVANEHNWDTVTPENEDILRIGGWLIEGERVLTDEEMNADLHYTIYAAYSVESRDGLYNVYESDNSTLRGPWHEPLRYEWGDRVWGGPEWRNR